MSEKKSELGKALPKLEGFKFPDWKSIVTGLFSNHLTWLFEPASILMLLISHFSHTYFHGKMANFGIDEKWAFSITCWVPGIVFFWVAAIGNDNNSIKLRQLFQKRLTASFLPFLNKNRQM